MKRQGWENAGACAKMRLDVGQLASRDWSDALQLARTIPLPWYRSQSLALLAECAPEERVDEVLHAAVEASLDTDFFRYVAVRAWTIEAAIARGRLDFARQTLADALRWSSSIKPAKSRASALLTLLQRSESLGEREALEIAEPLLDAAAVLIADPVKKWRKWGRSFVNSTVRILTRRHEALARNLLVTRVGSALAESILARHHAGLTSPARGLLAINGVRYMLAEHLRPSWLADPRSYCRIVEQGLTDLTPWHILDSLRSLRLFHGLAARFPARQLFPFAFRQDNDDVACWEKDMGERVFIVHDFASPGWEDEAVFDDVWAWFRVALDEMISWD